MPIQETLDARAFAAAPSLQRTVSDNARSAAAVSLDKVLLFTPILSVTVLFKAAVPPFGAKGIGIALGLIGAMLLVGLAANRLRLEPTRLALLCVAMSMLGLSQLAGSDSMSVPSLALLMALHIPYAFVLTGDGALQQQAVDFFLKIATLLACCALAQFIAQFLIAPRFIFPVDNFVPEPFLVQKFNAVAPLKWGSSIYRATGIFMLEPSYLAQYLALAVVVELTGRGRSLHLALYGLGVLVAYSGTGLLILAVCVPVLLVARRRVDLAAWLALGLLILFSAGDRFGFGTLLNRVGEFSASGSSGFARFVGGFELFDAYLWTDPVRAMIGYGAGSFSEYASQARFEVAEVALFKMVFEFGVAGSVVYFGFLFYCLFACAMPRTVVVALALTYFLNGLYVPFSHALALSLLTLPPRART